MATASVPAPEIPVRQNRATELRKVRARDGSTDLQTWARPVNSEAGGAVQGKIRAANAALRQQVNKMYKEQTLMCDKVNKQQNQIFNGYLKMKERLGPEDEDYTPRMYEQKCTWHPAYAQRPLPPLRLYRATKSGRVVRTEALYRRREFAVPEERTDSPVRELLEAEHKAKTERQEKLQSLFSNIKQWEESPAVVLHTMANTSRSGSALKKNWGLSREMQAWDHGLRHLRKEVEGLDPNSEEALRKIRYIRREQTDKLMDFKPGELTLKQQKSRSPTAVPRSSNRRMSRSFKKAALQVMQRVKKAKEPG